MGAARRRGVRRRRTGGDQVSASMREHRGRAGVEDVQWESGDAGYTPRVSHMAGRCRPLRTGGGEPPHGKLMPYTCCVRDDDRVPRQRSTVITIAERHRSQGPTRPRPRPGNSGAGHRIRGYFTKGQRSLNRSLLHSGLGRAGLCLRSSRRRPHLGRGTPSGVRAYSRAAPHDYRGVPRALTERDTHHAYTGA